MLRILSEKKKRSFYESNIGKTATVLFEDDVDGGKIHGFTENYVRIEADYLPELINQTKKVVMKKISDNMTMQIETSTTVPELA